MLPHSCHVGLISSAHCENQSQCDGASNNGRPLLTINSCVGARITIRLWKSARHSPLAPAFWSFFGPQHAAKAASATGAAGGKPDTIKGNPRCRQASRHLPKSPVSTKQKVDVYLFLSDVCLLRIAHRFPHSGSGSHRTVRIQ